MRAKFSTIKTAGAAPRAFFFFGFIPTTFFICGCAFSLAAPPTSQHSANIADTEDDIGIVMWAVPTAIPRSVNLQVRIAPRIPVKDALLTVTARGLAVSPERFLLPALEPSKPVVQPNSPPDPPALGQTYLYTFALTAPAAGTYQVF